jgi:hypothetical protein
MVYEFKNESIKRLFLELNSIVPIRLKLVHDLESNACMDFVPDIQSVVIRYKDCADENIDILHELIHVEMFFKDAFFVLAWQTGNPLATEEIRRAVFHIRNIVDDTYVFHTLHERFGVFPVSPIFFRACRTDCKRQKIQLMESEEGLNRVLIGAWRLRMAELCTQNFNSGLATSQRRVCFKFLETFSNQNAEIDQVLALLRNSVTPMNLRDAAEHSRALLSIRDSLGLSSEIVYLAKYERRNQGFYLERV